MVVLFRPEPRAIKRQVEELVERDYLERDESTEGGLHYVA